MRFLNLLPAALLLIMGAIQLIPYLGITGAFILVCAGCIAVDSAVRLMVT